MSFSQSVAQRTDTDVETVNAVLAKYSIGVQPTGAAPVPLVLERVRFAGVKRRDGRDDEPFEFDREFSDGLWAITSEVANLAGKSSVLFVVRWALTGRSHLTDDVESWIDKVEVTGVVGGERFTVEFTNDDDGLAGILTTANASPVPFEGAGSFEEVMDGFFLDRLRLEAMPFWQARAGGADNEGDRRRWGWASYFPAMHLRAENTSLLMQVFLGLPWAQTAATARVARNALRMERSARQRRRAEDEAAREQTLRPLRDELERARGALAELLTTRPPISPEEADARLATFARAVTMQREASTDVARAQTAIELTQLDYDDAVKRLDALEQTRVVRPLLGRLAPTPSFLFTSHQVVNELKRETRDSSREAMEKTYAAQGSSYDATDYPFGLVTILDVSAEPPTTPRLDTCVWVREHKDDGGDRWLVFVRVPGRLSTPSAHTRRPASARPDDADGEA